MKGLTGLLFSVLVQIQVGAVHAQDEPDGSSCVPPVAYYPLDRTVVGRDA